MILRRMTEWAHYSQQVNDMEKNVHDTLGFRIKLLEEEMNETTNAYLTDDAEEIVDGLTDMIVVAMSTLVALGVDVDDAIAEVHRANMSKKIGDKPGRTSGNTTDMMKPSGWKEPNHRNNTGNLLK